MLFETVIRLQISICLFRVNTLLVWSWVVQIQMLVTLLHASGGV